MSCIGCKYYEVIIHEWCGISNLMVPPNIQPDSPEDCEWTDADGNDNGEFKKEWAKLIKRGNNEYE